MGTAPIWLLDFDGVVNALSKRGGRTYWPDWRSASLDHPHGERTRSGKTVRLPLLWSQTVIDTITAAAAAGVDVRWLSTWREHTALLPDLIPGLPALPWLDEAILDNASADGLDPALTMYSGPWKVEVAKAYVPDEAPLLWTEDSMSVDLLSETWRRSRSSPTEFVRPRPSTGLVQKDVQAITQWVALHTNRHGRIAQSA